MKKKQKEKLKPTSANEESIPLSVPKKKNYVSISEYPGNYKPKNNIDKERELKISQSIINKINKINNNDNKDNNMVKSTRGSMNLNLYEICKRNIVNVIKSEKNVMIIVDVLIV